VGKRMMVARIYSRRELYCAFILLVSGEKRSQLRVKRPISTCRYPRIPGGGSQGGKSFHDWEVVVRISQGVDCGNAGRGKAKGSSMGEGKVS